MRSDIYLIFSLYSSIILYYIDKYHSCSWDIDNLWGFTLDVSTHGNMGIGGGDLFVKFKRLISLFWFFFFLLHILKVIFRIKYTKKGMLQNLGKGGGSVLFPIDGHGLRLKLIWLSLYITWIVTSRCFINLALKMKPH